jgi:Ca2+/H+ antiporter
MTEPLALGASILAGGMRYPRQTFNQTAARVSATSLRLAAIGLIIPTIFHLSADRRLSVQSSGQSGPMYGIALNWPAVRRITAL